MNNQINIAFFAYIIDKITQMCYSFHGDVMKGIDLDKNIEYKHASLRYFSENEHHITRRIKENVLVMVFDGVLRFSEDGVPYEVRAGEYQIQKSNCYQTGERASDKPKYLYVHFDAHTTDREEALPFRGTFDYKEAKNLMERLNRLSYEGGSHTEKTMVFFEILLLLCKKKEKLSSAKRMIEFVDKSEGKDISLEGLCEHFHFSKNHVINVVKKETGMTPVKYINSVKLKRARYLLEATSDNVESISISCGFSDYSHFYKLFCRETGMSPTEWRSRKQAEPVV